MSRHRIFRFRPNKLESEPPIGAPDDRTQLIQADQRFQAALGQAIDAGDERLAAVKATVSAKLSS
jgi:hypothetical protein